MNLEALEKAYVALQKERDTLFLLKKKVETLELQSSRISSVAIDFANACEVKEAKIQDSARKIKGLEELIVQSKLNTEIW